MEFESNRPVSDVERQLAETKKLTLQPLHGNITPDALSDTEIGSRNANSPALANIPIDTEQDSTPIQPTKSSLNSQTPSSNTASSIKKPLIGVVVGVVAFGALALYAFVR